MYDAIGNPTSYYNGTLSSPLLQWENGRQLSSVMIGTNVMNYSYNDEGVRVYKYANGVHTYYFVEGTKIIYELSGADSTFYLYDADGSPIGIKHISSETQEGYYSTYYFDKNLQGDIVGIYDEWGTKLVEYTYDAWGNFTATYTMYGENNEVVHRNPFLYRGYYYDYETGFYYLNSRYYDPVTGRFINADGYVNGNGDIIGYNMYAYCSNNPVMFTDYTGQGKIWDFIYYNILQPLSNIGDAFVDSIYCDLGFGSGIGASVTVCDMEGILLWREDSISLIKEPGEDYQIGRKNEMNFGFGGAGTSFTKGQEEFYPWGSDIGEITPIEPDFDLTWELGVQGYFFFGGTAKIGIDFEYFIDKLFFGG